MPVVNHMELASVFIENVQAFWPDGMKCDNGLLPVADAAPYVQEAAVGLSELPKTDLCCMCNT
jgi:hypothetical protein